MADEPWRACVQPRNHDGVVPRHMEASPPEGAGVSVQPHESAFPVEYRPGAIAVVQRDDPVQHHLDIGDGPKLARTLAPAADPADEPPPVHRTA